MSEHLTEAEENYCEIVCENKYVKTKSLMTFLVINMLVIVTMLGALINYVSQNNSRLTSTEVHIVSCEKRIDNLESVSCKIDNVMEMEQENNQILRRR
jgi:hypothetical protein